LKKRDRCDILYLAFKGRKNAFFAVIRNKYYEKEVRFSVKSGKTKTEK